MIIAKKNASIITLPIIITYWLYLLYSAFYTSFTLPEDFNDFALRIGITKAIHLICILVLIKLTGSLWNEMGFERVGWWRQVGFGLGYGLILFILINVVLNTLLSVIFPTPIGLPSVMTYFKQPENMVIWILLGVVGGGFVEELMRIFVLTQFGKMFGKIGLAIALVASSSLFGLGHLYQGLGSAIATGISGFILGAIFIQRGKAIEIITIHAFSDLLAILTAFMLMR